MSLLAVNNIRKEYRNKVVLADVSLQIERGDRMALIGPNGSGKTTLLKNPHCLILDEPTNHLDLESRVAIEKAISDYKGTVIAVSHDRYFLNKCVTRIIEIKDGKIRDFSGNYDTYKNGVSPLVADKRKSAVKKIKETEEDSSNKEERHKELELEIESLEEKIFNFEMTIDETFKFDDYRQYDEWTKQLNNLYTEYDKEGI